MAPKTPAAVSDAIKKLSASEQVAVQAYIAQLKSNIPNAAPFGSWGAAEASVHATVDKEDEDFPPMYEGDGSNDDFDKATVAKMAGSNLKSAGNFEEALEKYTEAVLAAEPSALLLANRAHCLFKLKRYTAAIRDCEVALEKNPDSAKSLRIRGECYLKTDQCHSARKDLSQAQAIDWDSEAAMMLKEATEKCSELDAEVVKKKLEEEEKLRKRAAAIKMLLSPKAPIKDDCFRAVTITVLSCDGVVAKRCESKTKKWKKRQVTKSQTSLAASFSQNLSSGDSFLTHVPSMPMEHLDTKPGKADPIPQPLVRWPSSEGGDDTVGKELSTLRFTQRFRQEVDNDNALSTRRVLPETISIKLSLSRSGKLISLGRADVVITSGEEKEGSFIDVPISSTIKKVGVSSPIKKSSKNRIPMVRIKGDDMQFGLKGDSTLRVLVSVTDVQEQDGTSTQDTEDVTTDDDECEVSVTDVQEQDGTSDVQGNDISRTDTEDLTTDDDECEVNDVTFELDDKFESSLKFLNGDGETGTLKLGEGDEADEDENEDKSTEDEDEETATDAAAMPKNEAEVDEDLVGEQKETVDTTDEEQEENTGNVEVETNNGIGAWFANFIF